ncbi:MAG: hypothetical protein LBF88_14605 [Planctomycetaceae bacterium]|jgi:hypothetical protein|nr:hypothetical protein [Planctomycetaceae bacterium]
MISERKFYLFAETPRAGKYNHRFLVPDDCDIPSDISLQTYIDNVRNDKDGKDFVGVYREVKQVDTNRFGKEILVLAVPYCDISHLAGQLTERLKSHQDELAEIVTEKIDWNKTGADNLSVVCPELADWQKEFEPLLKNIKPNPQEQKGNWIMRHKFLSLIIILILSVVCQYTVAQLRGNRYLPQLSELIPQPVDPRIELLEQWTLNKMPNQTAKELEQYLDQRLGNIPITYSPVNPDIRQRPTVTTLEQKLQVLSEVLEVRPAQPPMKELDDFLRNNELRDKVITLYSNSNRPFNPFMNIRNQNDEVERVFLHRQISLEQARKIIDAVINICRCQRACESQGNDPWIRFAKGLIFGQEDEQRWEMVKKYNPQWFTPADVELSKKIFFWLTNDDAQAVLPKELVNDYAEALKRFAKAEVKIEIGREVNRNEDKIMSENETHKTIRRTIDIEIDKNKETLKDALKKLQGVCDTPLNME